jgi:hypothetical protein
MQETYARPQFFADGGRLQSRGFHPVSVDLHEQVSRQHLVKEPITIAVSDRLELPPVIVQAEL